MARKITYNLDRGVSYAEHILSGSIDACEYIRLAADRFLNDLERKDIYMDPRKANRPINFLQQLPHVKGKWAAKAELMVLEDWQIFKYVNVFGFFRSDDHARRFLEIYTEVPRKNGKSFDAAGVGLYMLAADDEFGAEVYCGATSEKQAYEVFRPAKLMVDRTLALQEDLGIDAAARSILVPEDGSFFQPVIGNPGDGSSPHCGIVDEYHEHDNDGLYQTFQTGMGAREQPLMYIVTTAGDNIEGPCYNKREEGIQVLRGVFDDQAADSLFVLIYTIDPEDDWKSEKALIKANPNYDVSVSGKFLRSQQQKAIRSTKDQGFFKTKHLNIWVSATETFINFEDWKTCGDPLLKIEDYEHLPCVIGIDLSSKIDFTAAVICFYEDIDDERHYYWFPKFWLPEARYWEEERYHQWKEYITICEGDEINTKQVQDWLIDAGLKYTTAEYTIDPWRSLGYEQRLDEETGIELVKFAQSVAQYTVPMDELEASVITKRIHHPNDPVLNWMCTNLQSKRDTNGNHKPRKEDARKKIDGMCAGIMALGRCIDMEDQGPPGVISV